MAQDLTGSEPGIGEIAEQEVKRFGTELDAFRIEHGAPSVASLANSKVVGTSKANLSAIFGGKRLPTLEVTLCLIRAIARGEPKQELQELEEVWRQRWRAAMTVKNAADKAARQERAASTRVAEDTIAGARRQAQEILATTQAKANDVRMVATATAEREITDAKHRAARILALAQADADNLLAEFKPRAKKRRVDAEDAVKLRSEAIARADAVLAQLRTPLAILAMRLKEISEATDTETVKEEAAIALTQVERLTDLVQRLMTDSGDSRAESVGAPTDIDLIIRQQIFEWRPAFRSARRMIDVDGGRGLLAAATPGTLAQVLATLLENSLMHGAGPVTIRTRTAGGSVVIEVSDTGLGVPPELGGRIFERAVSGNSLTGLGLTVARELAEADGGRLELLQQRPPVFALFLPQPRH